jgi:hypothetical protein
LVPDFFAELVDLLCACMGLVGLEFGVVDVAVVGKWNVSQLHFCLLAAAMVISIPFYAFVSAPKYRIKRLTGRN